MVATRPTVTGILNTLERLGLVARRAHGSDGRMRLVALTDAGRDVVLRALPEVHRFERDVLGALDAGQQRDLLELLAAIAGRLEGSPADPG
jgi:DNA-binding MarR family transcriptional regulator